MNNFFDLKTYRLTHSQTSLRTHAFKDLKGFSLVELILVIALMGILGAVLGPGLSNAVREYDIIWSRRQTLAQSRAAIDRMVQEIRLIQSSADVLNVSSSTSFQFEYPDGTAITYSLSGSNLLRNTDILASSLTALTFSYFDSAGVATSTAANVRRVRINFTITAPGSHGSLTLGTDAFIRTTGGITHYDNFAIQ